MKDRPNWISASEARHRQQLPLTSSVLIMDIVDRIMSRVNTEVKIPDTDYSQIVLTNSEVAMWPRVEKILKEMGYRVRKHYLADRLYYVDIIWSLPWYVRLLQWWTNLGKK